MSRGWFVCRVPFWFCVLRGLVVSCWLGVVCAKIQFFALETCIFLSPRYYRVWARYYRFGRHGTTAPQHGTTALVRYFGSTTPGGTTVSGHGTTAPSRERGGYDSGRGVPTPHTHSFVSLPTSLSLSLKNGAGGPRRISVSGHSPRIPTGGIVPHHFLLPWTKVFPQIPLFLGCSLASRFLGRNLLFLRF